MPVVIEEKHPYAIKRLQIDWTDFAATDLDGELPTITNSVWVDAAPAAGVSLSDAQHSGFKTGTLVSGGTAGATSYVENHVIFSDGRLEVS